MKRLSVTLKLEMEVPDDWRMDRTSDGIDILKMGDGRYLDLALGPVCFDDKNGTQSSHPDAEFVNSTMLMVRGIHTEMRLEERAALLQA